MDATAGDDLWRRRDLLGRLGWSGVLAMIAVSTGGFVRMLFRRAPVEPPRVFSAGRPEEYAEGTVSERFLAEWRVYVVRAEGRLFAVHARCSHLGCTPRWRPREARFKCPCHGSGFHIDGENFEGPAPRPLDRAGVALDEAGGVVIDVARRFSARDWDDPGAFVEVERG